MEAFPPLAFAQFLLVAWGALWLLKRNDEIPILIAAFFTYCGAYRYYAVEKLGGTWVDVSPFGFEQLTSESAIKALPFMIVGQMVMVTTYCLLQSHTIPVSSFTLPQRATDWIRPKLLILSLAIFPLVAVTRAAASAQFNESGSYAFGVSSYLLLFPMVLTSIGLLWVLLWRTGGLDGHKLLKAVALISIAGVIWQSFDVSGRYKFLGWMIAVGIIVSAHLKTRIKIVLQTFISILVILIFSFAGALRYSGIDDDKTKSASWDRAVQAEDANMLDGLVLIQQVYPERLPYALGGSHAEILLRPIPRSIWPGKPVGGYMNKLGLTIAEGRGTLGISPSLIGSFYAEGSWFGIFFFASLYGAALAGIIRYAASLQPGASVLVRAVVCAALVPLLRGGDLPGIYAWLGMSFWPVAIFLYTHHRYLKLKAPVQSQDSEPAIIPLDPLPTAPALPSKSRHPHPGLQGVDLE